MEGSKFVKNHLRRQTGYRLSETLFIMNLQYVIKYWSARYNIKLSEIWGYADDIGRVTRSKSNMVEGFKAIKEKAQEVGLIIKEFKTSTHLVIDQRTFRSTTFKYLWNLIDCNANYSKGNTNWTQSYYMNLYQLKNKLLYRLAKMHI